MDKERLATAYHEAGHGVMAWLCGFPIQYLRLGDVPREEYISAGQTMLVSQMVAITDAEFEQLKRGGISPELRAKVEGWLMVYASGVLAEARFTGRGKDLESQFDDLRRMRQLCLLLGTGEVLHELQSGAAHLAALLSQSDDNEAVGREIARQAEQRGEHRFQEVGFKARAILYEPTNWKAVTAVAESLCRRGYLTGKQIDRIIRSAAPGARRLHN